MLLKEFKNKYFRTGKELALAMDISEVQLINMINKYNIEIVETKSGDWVTLSKNTKTIKKESIKQVSVLTKNAHRH